MSTYSASDMLPVRVQRTALKPRCASAPATTSAKAGKIGFCSSGTISPTIRGCRPRRCVGRSYPITSSAVSTAARVVSEIPCFPFRTRLTVASLTPACFAMSASLPAMTQDYCKILQRRSATSNPREPNGLKTTGSGRYCSRVELRKMGVRHGAPQSPAERDEGPGADDSVEEHRGDHRGACTACEGEPGAHGRFDRAAAARKNRDHGDELAERVGDDHSTDRDRLAHRCEGSEENRSVEQPVEKAAHEQQHEVVGGDRLLGRDVAAAEMSHGPECGGHKPAAAEDGCDHDGGRDSEHRKPGLRSEPVTADGKTTRREQHERHDA